MWDDIADIDELLSMSPDKTHVVTDNAVRALSSKVNVAIISPPGGMFAMHDFCNTSNP